jgi:hypothetical protein
MLESKISWALSAFVVAIATGMVAFSEWPGTWGASVIVVGGLAQGLLAWRAFCKAPPNP